MIGGGQEVANCIEALRIHHGYLVKKQYLQGQYISNFHVIRLRVVKFSLELAIEIEHIVDSHGVHVSAINLDVGSCDARRGRCFGFLLMYEAPP